MAVEAPGLGEDFWEWPSYTSCGWHPHKTFVLKLFHTKVPVVQEQCNKIVIKAMNYLTPKWAITMYAGQLDRKMSPTTRVE